MLLQVAPKEWQLCLEKIIELTEKNNNKLLTVLPIIDIFRVNEFIKFWKNIPRQGYFLRWFTIVLYKLELFIIEDDEIQKYLLVESNKAEIKDILRNDKNDRTQTEEEKKRRVLESEQVKARQQMAFTAKLKAEKVERNQIVQFLKHQIQIQIRAKEQDDKIFKEQDDEIYEELEKAKRASSQQLAQAQTQTQIQQARTQHQIVQLQQLITNLEIKQNQYLIELKHTLSKK